MALIVFRSKAAGEIFMFAETAQRIFEIIGKTKGARGVISVDEVPAALQALTSAVNAEKSEIKAAAAEKRNAAKDDAPSAVAVAVTLGQRAFPLIEMLRAAERQRVDVTWGI